MTKVSKNNYIYYVIFIYSLANIFLLTIYTKSFAEDSDYNRVFGELQDDLRSIESNVDSLIGRLDERRNGQDRDAKNALHAYVFSLINIKNKINGKLRNSIKQANDKHKRQISNLKHNKHTMSKLQLKDVTDRLNNLINKFDELLSTIDVVSDKVDQILKIIKGNITYISLLMNIKEGELDYEAIKSLLNQLKNHVGKIKDILPSSAPGM